MISASQYLVDAEVEEFEYRTGDVEGVGTPAWAAGAASTWEAGPTMTVNRRRAMKVAATAKVTMANECE